ncbi:hypothetical protein F753_08810 [Stutzerimonas chloritidismutans AW-1]|uniref:Uncharacterized protein n=1 Tax=Stutzerimonas chloritidismutans AW-1 TaxID=1263865 RepID=V4QJ02_STUCH|nr:hypothetical protein F753_08810 [Stutzerimonas chloritidismutans AW-1]
MPAFRLSPGGASVLSQRTQRNGQGSGATVLAGLNGFS